uniref:Uncharacterized protein n=1 Tax=Manihot esculenta TaxID=3983 RepID=A0A2C9WHW8_MANES
MNFFKARKIPLIIRFIMRSIPYSYSAECPPTELFWNPVNSVLVTTWSKGNDATTAREQRTTPLGHIKQNPIAIRLHTSNDEGKI